MTLDLRFEIGRKRFLTIDPALYESAGQKPPAVEAEMKQVVRHPTHEARHFQLSIADFQLPIASVQLNAGDPADDERRLAVIAEDLLAPVDQFG